jgi:hypothetical protein
MGMRLGFVASCVGTLLVPSPALGQEKALVTFSKDIAPITFSKDIAPILQRSCQRCHGPDGIAPMSLATYEEVRPWARAIKNQTMARTMPPWFIEKDVGIQSFKDDPSLSELEIATIASWVDSGAPRGNPADMPPPRKFSDPGLAAGFGPPDLVVRSPAFTMRAIGADWHGTLDDLLGREVRVPTGLTQDRWVKAVEVRERRVREEEPVVEGNGALGLFSVHHMRVNVVEAADGSQEDQSLFSYLYEVGQNAMIFPNDFGVTLPAGSELEFSNNHLHSIGREIDVQIEARLWLHPEDYQPKYPEGSSVGARVSVGPGDYELDIPSNTKVRYDHAAVLPRPAKLVTFEPHLHSSGERMCLEAIYADSTREMLNCARYNHNWVKVYVYEDDAAPLLPAGTILHVTAWYNNTVENPQVVDPRNWKGFGQRSIDDMFLLLSKFVGLTDEQFASEVAARELAVGGTVRETISGNVAQQ